MARVDTLLRRLADGRSKRVVFVSHCLLNENTRYLGGACRGGCVREVVEPLIRAGVGVIQMPCPEERAWGGVLKRCLVWAYGARSNPLYRVRGLVLHLFVWYTRRRYRALARAVARQVDDYLRSGFSVLGIVGVDGSPSCGVVRTLDLRRSSERLAELDPETVTVGEVTALVRGCVTEGEGLFTAALRAELDRRRISVPFPAHDLLAELAGESRVAAVLCRLGLADSPA
jgi:uncharacterized protein YbbK (DUF523 family)